MSASPAKSAELQQTAAVDTGAVSVRAAALTKIYGEGETRVVALDSVDCDIEKGRFTAVMGPSGSGKSTLMHCLAGLDSITGGEVYFGDVALSQLSDGQITRLRRESVGFVFQAFNLIPTLTARENITLPMDIAGTKPDEEWLNQVINTVGLRDRLKHKPSELSGGQQQRVACARALASRPHVIFADEPTGNLDSLMARQVMDLLEQINEMGTTIVLVTHDPELARRAHRNVHVVDGQISDLKAYEQRAVPA